MNFPKRTPNCWQFITELMECRQKFLKDGAGLGTHSKRSIPLYLQVCKEMLKLQKISLTCERYGWKHIKTLQIIMTRQTKLYVMQHWRTHLILLLPLDLFRQVQQLWQCWWFPFKNVNVKTNESLKYHWKGIQGSKRISLGPRACTIISQSPLHVPHQYVQLWYHIWYHVVFTQGYKSLVFWLFITHVVKELMILKYL